MRTLLSVVLIVSACALPMLGRSADCPPCYRNLNPPTGQLGEPAGDGTPRKVLHIKIDSSWNQSPGVTNHKVWNATAGCFHSGCNPPNQPGAVQKWNEATDGQGNTTDFYLKVVQDSSAPDFVIVKGDPIGGSLADIDLTGHPAVITLSPGNADMDLQSVAARIAHEMFGNFTPQPPAAERHGFLALAEFDQPPQGGNADGAIDAGDAVFSSLRLWRDADRDGLSRPGELHALPALDVARLQLDYKESKRVDSHGNLFGYRAKVDDARGAKAGRWAWDVILVAR